MVAPPKAMGTSIHRLTGLVACHLLIAFLLVKGSLSRRPSLISAVSHSLLNTPSSRTTWQSTADAIEASLRQESSGESNLDRTNQFSGLAFIHSARRVSRASHKATNRHDELNSGMMKQQNPLEAILSLRGGASSSSNNAVQNAVKSILSSSLPAPVKQFIETICQMIEKLTGCKVLPSVEKKKSRSKKSRSKEKEVLVEEVSVGTKKKRRSKRSSKKKAEEDLDEVETVVAKKKKRKSPKTEPKAEEPEKVSETKPAEKETPAASTPKPKPKKRPDVASQRFLANKMKSSNPNYRIQRELKEFLSSPPPGLSVKISGKNVRLWVVTLSMPDNTIYAGDKYRLRVQFPNDYPTSPPSVYFLPPTPRHEHVYTNGDICLSLLGTDWRPIMTAQSIAQAIMSILCGAQRKSLPMDNARHAGNKPGQKQDDWVYHDDNC